MLVVKKIKNQGKRTVVYVHGEGVDRKAKPHKPLTKILKKKSGRMKTGKISVRHRGGGTRRKYRLINFNQPIGEFTIERIEKDPNRTGFIALVDGEGKKHYFLATDKMRKGHKIFLGDEAEIKEGNRTTLSRIPAGTMVSNIELYPNSGGKIARSAGASAKLMGVEADKAQIKLPSGEIRILSKDCYATIGQISNPEKSAVKLGKAGRVRNMGRRPQVRGKVMNPVDHPHGGGEGNQPIGLPYPKTKWGKHALGVRTRKKNKMTNKYIIKRRPKKRK